MMTEMYDSHRTVEDVKEVLQKARIDEKELTNLTQTIYFDEKFPDNDLILMEADHDILETVLKSGSLALRGREDDEVALCTINKTYRVKVAETSNSVLLLPSLSVAKDEIQHLSNETTDRVIIPQKVLGIYHKYWEMTHVKPTFHRLHYLLEENLYEGKEFEEKKISKKYTSDDLLDVIQASEDELKEGMKMIEAYYIEGYWRLLEFDYLSRVLMHILNFIQENSWEYDKVVKYNILEVLQELEPREILEQCLHYYFEEVESECASTLLRLKEDNICRHFADMILRKSGKFNLKEFSEAWKLSVPEKIQTNLKQLEGMVLIENERQPHIISRLTIWDLPEEVEERFVALFKIRPKWRCEDIKPFIKDLASEKQTVDSLLTKYSRVFTANNERFCNARY